MQAQNYASLQSMGTMNSQIGLNDSSQKIQLFISARSLLDMDVFSKSDPYVKVYFKRSPLVKQIYLGRTQTISNDLNPNWNKIFTVDYVFQAKQQIKFQVFDQDDGKNDDFIGRVTTTIGALSGAKNQTSILDLQNPYKKGQKLGKLVVRVQPCQQCNQYLKMKWKARKLMNTDSWFDWWDKSDPYLKFLKIRSDNTFIQAARTQIIQNDLNPNWKPLQISLAKLLNSQTQNGKFKIQCWDWQQKGEKHHQFIGQFYTTVNQIQSMSLPAEFKLSNPKNKNPGFAILQNKQIILRPSFMDYLRGGLQLNLSIAIDFTGSNGIPTHPTSLHYMNPQRPNQYQVAIDAVARILLNYDTDKRIPAFGFGAKPHFPYLNSNAVSHCFPLSGNPAQIQAYGYEHLMNMYNNAITNVQLSGPTYFGPILRQAINISRLSMQQGSNVYQVLLILTDGQIHDMDETVNLLVNNCQLPLSLIIVGVGNAEFSNMVRLDGDNGLYATNGKKAHRDIVQFVPFRQVQLNPDLLAQQLLAELPNQVTQYMSMIGKQPGPPLQANIDDLMMQKQQMKPQQALKNQLLNMFGQQANTQ